MAGGGAGTDLGLQVLDAAGATVLAEYRPQQCGPAFIDGDDDWHHIDMTAFVGQDVRIRVFDDEAGGCGFVSADQLYFSGAARGDLVGVAATP